MDTISSKSTILLKYFKVQIFGAVNREEAELEMEYLRENHYMYPKLSLVLREKLCVLFKNEYKICLDEWRIE